MNEKQQPDDVMTPDAFRSTGMPDDAAAGYEWWLDEVAMRLDLQGQDEEEFAAYYLSPDAEISFG